MDHLNEKRMIGTIRQRNRIRIPKDAPAPSGRFVSGVSILHGAIRIIPDEQQKASGPG
jgi:hypothetical protein